MANGSNGLDCHLCMNFERTDDHGFTGFCKRHQHIIEEAYHSVCRDWFRDDVGSPFIQPVLDKLKPKTLYSIEAWDDLQEIADLS